MSHVAGSASPAAPREHAAPLKRLLGAVSARIVARGALYGAAGALIIGALALLVAAAAGGVRASIAWYSIGVALVGGAVGAWRARRGARDAALAVERAAPASRNVVMTAAEMLDGRARARDDIARLVWSEAARVVASMDARRVSPLGRSLAAAAGAVVLWLGAASLAVARPGAPGGANGGEELLPEIRNVRVIVSPPTYVGGASVTYDEPSRIDALAGSRVEISVRADAGGVMLETLAGRDSLTAPRAGEFAGVVRVETDGFIALEPRSAGGDIGVRRFIGLAAIPDRAPRVRITAPARDLFLGAADRPVDVVIEADDDLALASLRLRYTRVSGSGEQFTFRDGEVALTIERASARSWRARGRIPLDSLALTDGETLVYRGVATDSRPGAPAAESDSYIIEIVGPGAVAADGFATDDEQDRYGISQQMVILKTERLLARRASLSPAELERETLTLAAEQRRVRAEFVFMLGGEQPEDFDAEAELDPAHEHNTAGEEDVLAGRLANRGRVDLLRAIRSMSRAATHLGASDPVKALPEERAALASLQRAFARTRYILRALTQRERLDLSRRLTGALDEAVRSTRPVSDAPAEPRVAALRHALAEVAQLSGRAGAERDSVAVATAALAPRLVAIEPGWEGLRGVATHVSRAAAALSARRDASAAASFDSAATALAQLTRAFIARDPPRELSAALAELDGALITALRGAREQR